MAQIRQHRDASRGSVGRRPLQSAADHKLVRPAVTRPVAARCGFFCHGP